MSTETRPAGADDPEDGACSALPEQLAALDELGPEVTTAAVGRLTQDVARLVAGLPQVVAHHGRAPLVETIDPVLEPLRFCQAFATAGVVVVPAAVPTTVCAYAAERARDIVLALSEDRCDLADPSSWDALPVDGHGVPVASRGFLDIHHDDGLARVRQSPKLWLAHALIWGTARLAVTFDRYALKLPGGSGSDALPLHVDQNPSRQPGFATTQGLVALVDNPEHVGCFVTIPGSKARFAGWTRYGLGLGDYVPLAAADGLSGDQELWDEAVPVPLLAGDAVVWDSRTAHAASASFASARTGSGPVAEGVRLGALVSYGPAVYGPAADRRRALWVGARGINDRDALAHASFRPRFDDPQRLRAVRVPERLSPLGAALYDSERWDDLSAVRR